MNLNSNVQLHILFNSLQVLPVLVELVLPLLLALPVLMLSSQPVLLAHTRQLSARPIFCLLEQPVLYALLVSIFI